MPLSNSEMRYGAVAKTLHWTTALLILTLIPLGMIAEELPYETSAELATKTFAFSLHKTLGVAVFFVALIRILWALTQKKPGLLNADKPLEATLAETVHWLLYGSLVLVPLTGWVHHAAVDGYAPIWWPFGQNLPFVAKDAALSETASVLHEIFGKVLIVSLILHIAGAVKHHVIDRDPTLLRMLPGFPAVPPLPKQHHNIFAPILAVMIWAGVVLAGVAAGAFTHTEQTASAPALEQADSEWAVQTGQIAITVQQMGSAVEGQFQDWTAAIAFAPDAEGPVKGHTTVTISIPSLTLGTVSDQAMGPDYFDAETYQTAVFDADLVQTETGHEAQGTLTIKGTSVPATLPFDLQITGDTATANGTMTVDRRAFAIGDGMTDEANLGFNVQITVALTATR